MEDYTDIQTLYCPAGFIHGSAVCHGHNMEATPVSRTDGWLIQTRHIHTLDYDSALKRKRTVCVKCCCTELGMAREAGWKRKILGVLVK